MCVAPSRGGEDAFGDSWIAEVPASQELVDTSHWRDRRSRSERKKLDPQALFSDRHDAERAKLGLAVKW
jgi:hypothetical protein